jgi:hypothetical protein
MVLPNHCMAIRSYIDIQVKPTFCTSDPLKVVNQTQSGLLIYVSRFPSNADSCYDCLSDGSMQSARYVHIASIFKVEVMMNMFH